MADPFVAEIRIFAGAFAPKGWALCNGQLIPISQNTALFSLVGVNYGGNGTSNFALPNLQGSAPMQTGQGAGLSLRSLGETGGEQSVTLLQSEMPSHSHPALAAARAGAGVDPINNTSAEIRGYLYTASSGNNVQMSPLSTSIAGGSQPHNNMMPFLGLTFIIALQGVFPPRG